MKYLPHLILLFVLQGCLENKPIKIGLEGQKLPSFNFTFLDNATKLNTDSIKSGQPFAIFYYSPDCAYCKAQIRDLVNHSKDLNDVKIYLLTNHSISSVKTIVNKFNLHACPNIIAAIDEKSDLVKYLYITSVPFFAIYDKEKKLNSVFVGKTEYKTIRESILNTN